METPDFFTHFNHLEAWPCPQTERAPGHIRMSNDLFFHSKRQISQSGQKSSFCRLPSPIKLL